jgi:hypothetical protein
MVTKRVFKDADKKYTRHIGKLTKKIKNLDKSRTAWMILAVGCLINLVYLLCMWYCDRQLIP